MQVLSEGAIMFDSPLTLYTPQQHPLEGFLARFQIASVFHADHDPRSSGTVRYRVFTMASDPVLRVSQFIRNRNISESFMGTWMLLVEWRDVPEFLGDPAVVCGLKFMGCFKDGISVHD